MGDLCGITIQHWTPGKYNVPLILSVTIHGTWFGVTEDALWLGFSHSPSGYFVFGQVVLENTISYCLSLPLSLGCNKLTRYLFGGLPSGTVQEDGTWGSFCTQHLWPGDNDEEDGGNRGAFICWLLTYACASGYWCLSAVRHFKHWAQGISWESAVFCCYGRCILSSLQEKKTTYLLFVPSGIFAQVLLYPFFHLLLIWHYNDVLGL